jgi:hypothetical protein
MGQEWGLSVVQFFIFPLSDWDGDIIPQRIYIVPRYFKCTALDEKRKPTKNQQSKQQLKD